MPFKEEIPEVIFKATRRKMPVKEHFKLKDIFKVPCGGFSFLFSTTRGAVELRELFSWISDSGVQDIQLLNVYCETNKLTSGSPQGIFRDTTANREEKFRVWLLLMCLNVSKC